MSVEQPQLHWVQNSDILFEKLIIQKLAILCDCNVYGIKVAHILSIPKLAAIGFENLPGPIWIIRSDRISVHQRNPLSVCLSVCYFISKDSSYPLIQVNSGVFR